MENSEAVWSDEQLSGARELMAPGPFASEEQTAALDEAVAVLERADRLDERATAALATLAGPAYVPIAPPMHVMGGFRADVHNWWFEWPDHYFVPGDSQERGSVWSTARRRSATPRDQRFRVSPTAWRTRRLDT